MLGYYIRLDDVHAKMDLVKWKKIVSILDKDFRKVVWFFWDSIIFGRLLRSGIIMILLLLFMV